MSAVLRWLIGVLVFVLAFSAHADRAAKPVLIRIQGHVGAPRPEDRKIAELKLRDGNKTIDLTVAEIWVLSGNAVGVDILHEVEQYDPNMTVSGPSDVLGRLANASPDQRLDVTGYYRRGQRMLMLSGVEPAKTK